MGTNIFIFPFIHLLYFGRIWDDLRHSNLWKTPYLPNSLWFGSKLKHQVQRNEFMIFWAVFSPSWTSAQSYKEKEFLIRIQSMKIASEHPLRYIEVEEDFSVFKLQRIDLAGPWIGWNIWKQDLLCLHRSK